MNSRNLVVCAALVMAVGVGAGAFGAHALRGLVAADRMPIWQTAVLYQIIHGLGMLAVALLGMHMPSPRLRLAGGLMLAGIVIFSGSLYTLVLTDTRWLGAITPFGGVAFIAAWCLVALAALDRTP
ncbi:MAG TPA: DUF423 domain-containing protein [Candidimonas sp.]|nr:DUF423 domain-containing protein [Candidimonas sp.]